MKPTMVDEASQKCQEIANYPRHRFYPIYNDAPTQVLCPSKNKVVIVCTNPYCAEAFLCFESDCQHCKFDNHQLCRTIKLKGLRHMISRQKDKTRDFTQEMIHLHDELLQMIRLSRMKLEDMISFGTLEYEYRQIVKDIAAGGEIQISGKQANELCRRLQCSTELETQKREDIVDFFEYNTEAIKDILKRQAKYIENVFSERKQVIEVTDFYKCLNSTILNNQPSQERRQNIDFIWKALHKPYKLQLLFRASEHQFKAQYFHYLCDNVQDTFTLLQNIYGKILGGYSHYAWDCEDKFMHGNEQKASFLLSLDRKEKLLLNSTSNFSYYKYGQAYGPCFGMRGLQIVDNCNTNECSLTVPVAYGVDLMSNSEEANIIRRQYTGSSTGKFKVNEYEVYRIIYQYE